MVGIVGITVGPVRANKADPSSPREWGDAAPLVPQGDDVEISSQAHEVSQMAKMLSAARDESDFYAERLAEVKKSLEDGAYRVQEMVAIVAARISKYVALE